MIRQFRLLFTFWSMTVLFLVFGGPLFAQTDYFFVLEKPAPQSVSTTVFQVLVSALVTDNDTAGAVSCGDNASLLFAPLSGGTPNLAELAAAKLHSDPLKGAGAGRGGGVVGSSSPTRGHPNPNPWTGSRGCQRATERGGPCG